MEINKNQLITALKKENRHDLRKMHLFLNQMYHTLIFNTEESDAPQLMEYQQFKDTETIWSLYEKNECFNLYPCDQRIVNMNTIENALKNHFVYNHPLFDYFYLNASIGHLKTFLLNESVLNLEFFDYLAFSLIGVTDDDAKAEIATNLWDEAGRGNKHYFHTNLYKKLLKDLGLDYQRHTIIEQMPWEGLAGINLFSYLAHYPFNKMKFFGLMAATEMLDPLHYGKFVSAIRRILGSQKIDLSYYTEHEVIDVEHARGWIKKIILPELERKPHLVPEFWLGFYMRLHSTKRYYDQLLHIIYQQQVA